MSSRGDATGDRPRPGSSTKNLLSEVGAGGAYAGAEVPAGFAAGVAGGDVVERTLIRLSVGILAVERGERLIGGLGQVAGGVGNASNGG